LILPGEIHLKIWTGRQKCVGKISVRRGGGRQKKD